jgi:hypothetical protein
VFGRKKESGDGMGAKATVADEKEQAMALLEEQRHMIAGLMESGSKGRATIQKIESEYPMRGIRTDTITARLQPLSGDAFDTPFSLAPIGASGTDAGKTHLGSELGSTAAVVFDPADHSKVAFDNRPRVQVRWRVPAECPSCGAPVDQAGQAMSEHPTCSHCHNPLPAEPG